MTRYRALPGGDLIEAGLADLRQGEFTAEALLVSIGAPRLRGAGMALPAAADEPEHPELALYERLCREGGDAYSRYNAYLRRLVSFERALDLRGKRRGVDSRPVATSAFIVTPEQAKGQG